MFKHIYFLGGEGISKRIIKMELQLLLLQSHLECQVVELLMCLFTTEICAHAQTEDFLCLLFIYILSYVYQHSVFCLPTSCLLFVYNHVDDFLLLQGMKMNSHGYIRTFLRIITKLFFFSDKENNKTFINNWKKKIQRFS